MTRLLLLASLVVPSFTFAQSAADLEATPVERHVQHRFSLTMSPVHLALPVVELTGEFRLLDKLGVAAVAGAGNSSGIFVGEAGAQIRYYLIGTFIHGMQVGGEIL